MRTRKNRASSSVVVLLIMTLLLAGGMTLAGMTLQELSRTERDEESLVAFQAAQAGLEFQIAQSYDQLDENNGQFVSGTQELCGLMDPINEGGCVYSDVIAIDDGTFSRAYFTAWAIHGEFTRSVRAYVRSRNVSIWNNAIFAGTGAAGQAINGNVDIRGSVHILGDGEAYDDLNGNGTRDPAEPWNDTNKNGVWDPGEPFTDTNSDGVWNVAEPYNDTNSNGVYDPPLTVTDLSSDFSGTAYIGNNYSGMPTTLRGLVPAPPVDNGIETLGTEVRAKHGQISINGNAKIGSDSPVDYGLSKAKVDGVYVNDGFTGNSGAAHVNSDNGTTNQYDLDNLGIEFPLITGIGAQEYVDEDGGTWEDQKLYLDDRAMVIPQTQVTNATTAINYGPDAKGNRFQWTPPVKSGTKIVSPGVLHIEGVVKVNGDFTIGASKEDIRYTGDGTIYATQDIHVHSNFLPRSDLDFPTEARVGLIAQRNMYLAAGSGDAQLMMAGAFYAQGTIVSRKQNQIAGTFVANFFDMGTNVPNIYQCPSLVYNMPPAMPGDEGFYTVKIETWRERDPLVSN